MTTMESQSPPQPAAEGSILPLLPSLEELMKHASSRINERGYFAKLGEELRRLHAGLRIHHTSGFRRGSHDATVNTPPELVEVLASLTAERPTILGNLDRLTRASEQVGDQSLEDRDVFILRVKELIAMLRRHQAEEDRLFHTAVWQDTGGES